MFPRESRVALPGDAAELSSSPTQPHESSSSPTSERAAWHERLPACARCVVAFFYSDLLEVDDTFEVAMRKMLLGLGPFMFWFGPAGVIALLMATAPSQGDDMAGLYVGVAAMVVLGLLWYGTFVLGRRDHVAAGAGPLTDAWLLGTMLVLVFLTTAVPLMPWNVAAVQIFLLGLAVRATRRWLLLALASVVYFMACFNREAFHRSAAPEFDVAVIPGFYSGSAIAHRYLYEAIMAAVFVPVIVAVELNFRESERQQAASRESVLLARSLAAALSRYDTHGAGRAIQEARDGGTRVDDELLSGFEAIVANLTAYRPHLPNWLVAKAASSGDGTGDRVGVDEDGAGTQWDTVSTTTRSSRRSQMSVDAGGSEPARSPGRDPLRRRGSVDSRHGRRNSNAGSQGRTGGAGVHQHQHQHQAHPQHQLQRAHQLHAAGLRQMDPALRSIRASIAELDFWRPAMLTDANAIHAFVDRVFCLARQTHAAVHSLIGDSVLATWNAASGCHHPEAKAARFAARLRRCAADATAAFYAGGATTATRDAPPPAGFNVTGVIGYGRATVLLGGLGDQRALTANFGVETHALHRIARDRARARGAVFLTAAAADDVAYAVHAELAAAVCVPRAERTVPPATPPERFTAGVHEDAPLPQAVADVLSPPPPRPRRGDDASFGSADDATDTVALLYALRYEQNAGPGDEWLFLAEGSGDKAAGNADEALRACDTACRQQRYADALRVLDAAAAIAPAGPQGPVFEALRQDLRQLPVSKSTRSTPLTLLGQRRNTGSARSDGTGV